MSDPLEKTAFLKDQMAYKLHKLCGPHNSTMMMDRWIKLLALDFEIIVFRAFLSKKDLGGLWH